MDGIIQVMDLALSARDPYTVSHQKRVAHLSCSLGRELGLEAERLEALRIVGSLHDLGKIAVPMEILSKPGKLTDIEFAMIKTHSQAGYDILQPLNFPGQITQIILQHHERIDGSGYPRGRKGKDILLEARILGVADVVEAMCSHRPYRPSLGWTEALEEISRHRGKLYDPMVVDACLKLYAENFFHQTFMTPTVAAFYGKAHHDFHFPPVNRSDWPKTSPPESKAADFPLFPTSWSRFFLQAAATFVLMTIVMVGTRTI